MTMSTNKGFLKSGHLPTLFSSFLYFDVSFMIWVMIGAVSTFIVQDFGLTDAQKGLMVGIPILGGSLLRIPMGLLSDRFGGKRMGIIGMLLTMIPLLWGWLYGNSLTEVQAFGFLLGIAGASFAVALPLASRWYPPEHQGLAMGIAGAGNSGTVLATLFAPRIAEAWGWHSVFGFALIPLLIAFVVFIIFAKEPDKSESMKLSQYLSIVKYKETWMFSFFYSLTFGGFVGLTSYLSIFFVDQYHISRVSAGDYVTIAVFAGSFIRPIGGYIADKLGGINLLFTLYALSACILAIIGLIPPTVGVVLTLFIILMLVFGVANGAIFQVIPTRFPKEVGIFTGFVGAFGGVGGFFLPNILGSFKEFSGTYSFGYWWIALTFTVAILLVMWLRRDWKKTGVLK